MLGATGWVRESPRILRAFGFSMNTASRLLTPRLAFSLLLYFPYFLPFPLSCCLFFFPSPFLLHSVFLSSFSIPFPSLPSLPLIFPLFSVPQIGNAGPSARHRLPLPRDQSSEPVPGETVSRFILKALLILNRHATPVSPGTCLLYGRVTMATFERPGYICLIWPWVVAVRVGPAPTGGEGGEGGGGGGRAKATERTAGPLEHKYVPAAAVSLKNGEATGRIITFGEAPYRGGSVCMGRLHDLPEGQEEEKKRALRLPPSLR